jgi:hypothetical protein
MTMKRKQGVPEGATNGQVQAACPLAHQFLRKSAKAEAPTKAMQQGPKTAANAVPVTLRKLTKEPTEGQEFVRPTRKRAQQRSSTDQRVS